MALGHSMQPNSSWLTLAAGALAASAADTWATEIGALSPQTPRSILNGKRVPVGTSGGVTFAGLTAALAASLFLAAVIALVRWPAPAAVAALAGGFGGCQVDSLLGASAQARYWCASCAATTERRTHHCGNTTAQVGGWRALNNDGVNVLATVSGALMGWSVARLV